MTSLDKWLAQFHDSEHRGEFLRPLVLNIMIGGLWFYLYRPLYGYFGVIFTREDFRTNQILLVGLVLLLVYQVWQEHLPFPFLNAPQFHKLPFLLAVGGSVLFLLTERFLDVNTLSASIFGLATYGLLGFWVSPARWRQGFPIALLFVGVLPFGEHMQTFIGYPMRIFTAYLVQHGLLAAGVKSVGVDTILVFENGVSKVDLPCSGVKSLWTGLLFLLAATWIEKRPLSLRLGFIALFMAGLLFIVNLLRVAILTVTGPVLGWNLLAEMLHVPLGILGFGLACAVGVWLLRRLPEPSRVTPETDAPDTPPTRWLAPFLILVLVLMIVAYAPRPETGLTQASVAWAFPDTLHTEALPLKPDELAWLTRDGAESAYRQRFQWGELSGTMILITSTTWRAHHRPERCFEVYGLSVDDSRTHLVDGQIPVRFVTLGDGNHHSLLSATYWFQSSNQITDDYATRIWADLAPERDRWVLVSVLFDETVEPDAANVTAFYEALKETVAANLAP
ncbi:MAG: exosortase O [Anaerolineae bacterium]|nr:exosortase O [Anaerolineae bacterium]